MYVMQSYYDFTLPKEYDVNLKKQFCIAKIFRYNQIK